MTLRPVFDVAVKRIAKIMATHDVVSVAFSGGKDSTILLAAAIIAADGKPVIATHNDYEATDPMTWQHLADIGNHPLVKLRRFCFPIVRDNHCSVTEPFWSCWNPADKHRWIWPLPDGAQPLPDGFDWDAPLPQRPRSHDLRGNDALWPAKDWGESVRRCELVGLRSAESPRRRQILRHAGGNAATWFRPANHQTGECATAAPIAEMTTPDVWHAQHHHATPIGITENPFYAFAQKRIGGVGQKARVHNDFTPSNTQLFSGIGRDFPEWLERMMNRVEGIATIARYGTGVLFGRGDYRTEFPPNTDWPKIVANAVARLTPPMRTNVAKMIRTSIRHHRKHTTEPIPIAPPHPLTGVSWQGIHRLAVAPPMITDELMLIHQKNLEATKKHRRKTAHRPTGFGGGHKRKAK